MSDMADHIGKFLFHVQNYLYAIVYNKYRRTTPSGSGRQHQHQEQRRERSNSSSRTGRGTYKGRCGHGRAARSRPGHQEPVRMEPGGRQGDTNELGTRTRAAGPANPSTRKREHGPAAEERARTRTNKATTTMTLTLTVDGPPPIASPPRHHTLLHSTPLPHLHQPLSAPPPLISPHATTENWPNGSLQHLHNIYLFFRHSRYNIHVS